MLLGLFAVVKLFLCGLLQVIVMGIPTVERAVINKDDKTGLFNLLVEGTGLQVCWQCCCRYCCCHYCCYCCWIFGTNCDSLIAVLHLGIRFVVYLPDQIRSDQGPIKLLISAGESRLNEGRWRGCGVGVWPCAHCCMQASVVGVLLLLLIFCLEGLLFVVCAV
jgi:hypothetical protein